MLEVIQGWRPRQNLWETYVLIMRSCLRETLAVRIFSMLMSLHPVTHHAGTFRYSGSTRYRGGGSHHSPVRIQTHLPSLRELLVAWGRLSKTERMYLQGSLEF